MTYHINVQTCKYSFVHTYMCQLMYITTEKTEAEKRVWWKNRSDAQQGINTQKLELGRIFMKTLCNWLKTTLKRDAGSNLNNCQCWQEVKGILLSVSGRPRLIYWTHRFDDLALISPRFSSLATFGLLFVVTFNCHKQEAELIHTLVCRADYTAFGLVNNFYFFKTTFSETAKSLALIGDRRTKGFLLAATPLQRKTLAISMCYHFQCITQNWCFIRYK